MEDPVALGTIIALVVQTGALFYWGGRLSERQKVHAEEFSRLDGRLERLEQQMTVPRFPIVGPGGGSVTGFPGE